MLRLTTRTDTPRVLTKSGRDAVLALQMMGYDSTAMEIDDILKRLAEYEDTGLYPEDVSRMLEAKRRGILKEMPCTVEDTVWEIRANSFSSSHKGRLRDYSVRSIWPLQRYPDRCYVRSKKCTKSDLNFIGKFVFLTEEEALSVIQEAKKNGTTD